MSGWITVPPGDFWLGNATLSSGRRADLRIEAGRIAGIAPPGTATDGVDLRGGMVLPCFVDIHTHLDKGHIWPRAPNPDGTFLGALGAVRADHANWSEADLRARFAFGLACAHAHGTAAIRTHLDTYFPHADDTWRVFRDLRDAWAGRIALQGVSIAPLDHFAGDNGRRIADLVAASGGVLGCVTRFGESDHGAIPSDFDDRLDGFLALAAERGLDVDLHVDETGDTRAAALPRIARAVLRRKFRGRVQVGHCCSLARMDDRTIMGTIGLVAEAELAVVSLPMCNLYLQDRAPGRTPRWRGITLLHEFAAAGVPVSLASDNCRDPFFAFGDHDMWEVFREAVRIGHLDQPIARWAESIAAIPASVMGIDAGQVTVGAPADLVLFRGRDYSETLSRSQHDRVVLRRGRAIDATLPDYAELDGLMRARQPGA
jgi:cytosine deaminase